MDSPAPTGPSTDAIEAAYGATYRRLVSRATRALRDRDSAEDVVAEAFLRLVVASRSGTMPDNTAAWLHRVVGNLVIDHARRQRAVRWEPELVVDGPERAIEKADDARELRAALVLLPGDAQRALVMSGVGFRPQEIATHLGRSGNATRALLSRARRRTRELMAEPVV